MKEKYIAISAIMLICLAGCSQLQTVASTAAASLPQHYVLVSVKAIAHTEGDPVDRWVSPDGATWDRNVIIPSGGITRANTARPYTPPGIAANRDIYLVAYWGGYPGFNHLHLAVSEDGLNWDLPAYLMLANPRNMDNNARPSVAYHFQSNRWFVAYRDAFTGTIEVFKLIITCRSGVMGSCWPAGRGYGRSEYGITLETRTYGPGVSTYLPPTLSYVNDELVLMYIEPISGKVRVLKSTDGDSWTVPTNAPGGFAVASGAPLTSDGAPYLTNTLGTLFLATTAVGIRTPGGGRDIRLWKSVDGVEWVHIRDIINVGTSLGERNEPAIAGPEQDMIVAYAAHAHPDTTTILNPHGSTSLKTDTYYSVGIAFGR